MTIAIAKAGGPITLTATHAERSQRRERITGFPRVLIVGIGKGVKYDFASPWLRPLFDASDRVAPGRYLPGAPTDPYVPALEHTVPQIMDSLRA